jgi:murein DD-endopeptidase MepM/ murein hydrolase activator NlpD
LWKAGLTGYVQKRYKKEYFMSKRDEISSKLIPHKSLFAIALGAIFLLLGMFVYDRPFVRTGLQAAAHSANEQAAPLYGGALSAYMHGDGLQAPQVPEFVLLGNTSIVAVVPPITVTPSVVGAILGGSPVAQRTSAQEVTHYHVEEGDTIQSIADAFGISVNTIVWANDLSSNSTITVGDELIILPVSGAMHLVRPGDTISEIALWYRADAEDILDFNDVDSADGIFVGDILVIPGGRKPNVLPNGRLTPLAGSYFIYPVPRSYKITQRVHPFNAIDFANGACGGPVYAAAGGVAQVVGYNNGLGNYVRILHPNGVVTVYAHLSSQAVTTGERALQGQIIGYIGHTGRTIPAGPAGCHLHFEVRGATNPFR